MFYEFQAGLGCVSKSVVDTTQVGKGGKKAKNRKQLLRRGWGGGLGTRKTRASELLREALSHALGDPPNRCLLELGGEAEAQREEEIRIQAWRVQRFPASGLVGGAKGRSEAMTYRVGVQMLAFGDPAAVWCTHARALLRVTCFLCPGFYTK